MIDEAWVVLCGLIREDPSWGDLTSSEVFQVLTNLNWNWDAVANLLAPSLDRVSAVRDALQACFEGNMPVEPNPPQRELLRDTAFSDSSMKELQEFAVAIAPHFPTLMGESPDNAQISRVILADMGLAHYVPGNEKCEKAISRLEDDALVLAQWRERLAYLTMIDDAVGIVARRLHGMGRGR